jgi:hypothetical protein
MLTSDKVKPELLCPRWLRRWMAGCKLPIYCTGCRAHTSMEGANGCHRGTYGHREGHVRPQSGAHTDEIGAHTDEREARTDEKEGAHG